MSFYDVKSPGDVIQSSDWNAFTDFTEAISGISYKHSGNRLIHSPSSNLKIWFDSLYSPTGLQTGLWSGASEFYSFSSNAQSLYHPSGLVISGQEYSKAVASAQIALYDETYSSEGDLTSVLDDNYAGSGAFKTHKEDEDIHFPSSQMREWFNALYQESGTSATSDVAWSGALEFYGFSSNVKDDLLSLFSASTSLDNRIDILEGQDVFDHELYSLSSNLYNRAWIDALSGNIDSRIDALGGFDPTEYITSTNAILRFAGSSAALSKYLASSAFKRLNWNSSLWDNSSLIWDNSLQSWKAMKSGGGISQDVAWSSASDFYGFSSNTKLLYHPSGLVISGQQYSQAYASAQIALYKIQHGITSWNSTEFINSGIKWDGTNWIAMPSGGSGGDGSSQWTNRTGGIYYENEVSIGHAGFDLGDYKFQVSGPTYLSGQVTFKGSTFSGLADPTFPSGAANKHYVDTISSNINSKIIETSNGYANIQSGDSISHGLSSTPSYASISPSGMSINFGASCRIEGSNIIAYLTAPGYRNVFWTASL